MANYALILAAGKGTRMKTKKNKVLHKLGGQPMIRQIYRQLEAMGNIEVGVIVGYQREAIMAELGDAVKYFPQESQDGTGHAVKMAQAWLGDLEGHTMVLTGDTPLLRAETLQGLMEYHIETGASCTVLTANLDVPGYYGRIIRDAQGQVIKIVEERDASQTELAVKEVNSGIYCFNNRELFAGLAELGTNNDQGEYYLTDMVEIFNKEKKIVKAYRLADSDEIIGINDRQTLALAEKIMRIRLLNYWMDQGVTIQDPDSTYIESDVQLSQDVTILAGTHLRGQTSIGENSIIGPNTELDNVQVGENTRVQQTVAMDAKIGDRAKIGPFAYIRPGSEIGHDVRIGDFVEIKNSKIGNETRIAHLTYIGDAELGQDINIGCGTITVNYDGKNKHKTTIGDQAFVGCNVNLIAPVEVGARAIVAAGSTINKDVPEDALAIARNRQENKEGYAKRKR